MWPTTAPSVGPCRCSRRGRAVSGVPDCSADLDARTACWCRRGRGQGRGHILPLPNNAAYWQRQLHSCAPPRSPNEHQAPQSWQAVPGGRQPYPRYAVELQRGQVLQRAGWQV